MGGSVVASSVWTSGVSWVSWPSRLPKRHRHQTQILKEQQKSQSQTAQMPSTGQACRRARAMGQEASSPHCLHTTSTQRLPPAAESSNHHSARRESGPGRSKLPTFPRSPLLQRHLPLLCWTAGVQQSRIGVHPPLLEPRTRVCVFESGCPLVGGRAGQARMTTDRVSRQGQKQRGRTSMRAEGVD